MMAEKAPPGYCIYVSLSQSLSVPGDCPQNTTPLYIINHTGKISKHIFSTGARRAGDQAQKLCFQVGRQSYADEKL